MFKHHFLDDCVAVFNLGKNHKTAKNNFGNYSRTIALMQNCDTEIVKLKLIKKYITIF